ncbi:MAG: DNA-3-methyladenine glycosylase I [Paraglaciecola sp.]|jgi:DNA-3-methyladenine glycosylase I
MTASCPKSQITVCLKKKGKKLKKTRCAWVGKDKIYQQYHDLVWGRAVVDSQELFAKLCLDGQQAGLSWLTILKKQKNYEQAFCNFEPLKISQMNKDDIERQMHNKGIVRNRLKINAIVKNARAYLVMEQKGINFSEFIWQFVGGKTTINSWRCGQDVPITTDESDRMARALKLHGFSFVGPTICYAFMQAVGLVNDHTQDCCCYTSACNAARY